MIALVAAFALAVHWADVISSDLYSCSPTMAPPRSQAQDPAIWLHRSNRGS